MGSSKWLGKALSSFIGTAVLALGVGVVSPLTVGALASQQDEFVTQDDLTALKEEVKTLKDELKSVKVMKAEVAPAITGNVYSELARKIKIGGQLRMRHESWYTFFPSFSGAGGSSHVDYTLLRTRVNVDADINDYLRAFVELQDSRVFGEEGSTVAGSEGTTADTEGGFDLLQGFTEIKSLAPVSSALSDISVLVGRWRLNYGKERIIGPLDWSNIGRSWDGSRVRWSGKNGTYVDAFVTQVNEDPNYSKVVDKDEIFWGVYSHLTFAKGIVDEIEPYFLGRNTTANRSFFGIPGATLETENRYTAGIRVAGEPTVLPGLDYDAEANYQFGNVIVSGSNFDIQDAYSIFASAGYTCKNIAWTPRIGGKFSFATGDDDSSDDETNTFDQMYPTGHAHLGYIDLVGRQNIFDYELNLSAKPTQKWLLNVDYHWFELDQEEDLWYGVGGTANGGWTGVGSKPDEELGQEIDITAKYAMFKNFSVTFGYSHFFIGDFIEDDNVETMSGSSFGDTDADWFYIMTVLNF